MEFSLELSKFSSLEEPDLYYLRNERMERNKQLLKSISPVISALIFEQVENRTVEELAAIKIQCLVRKFLARRRYAALLREQFELEEKQRFTKTLLQLQEGELLVQNRFLEQRIDENAVGRHNRLRRRKANAASESATQKACTDDEEEDMDYSVGSRVETGCTSSAAAEHWFESTDNLADDDDDDTRLAEPDWSALEAHLRATQMEEREQLAYRAERDRVLADLSAADGFVDANVHVSKTDVTMCYREVDADDWDTKCVSGGRTRRNVLVNELTKPMQLCFINDMSSDEEEVTPAHQLSGSRATADERMPTAADLLSLQRDTPFEIRMSEAASRENLLHRQSILQEEARVALAQVLPMARMQLEIERQAANVRYREDHASCAASSALAGQPQLLLLTAESQREQESRRFGYYSLQRMSLAQLQVLFNQLKSRVEDLNEDLVYLLMERDDNHTEQDAMLVDVEDLTRRVKEISAKVQENHQAPENGSINDSKVVESFDKTSSFSSLAGRTIVAAKTVVLRSAEMRVAAVTSRFRPNKLMSMFASNSHVSTSI